MLRAADVDPRLKKSKCSVKKNRCGHNFQNIASTISNQHVFNIYENTLIDCGTDILHILKAIDRTVNLSHLESILEHPARRHSIANTVGLVCKLDRTLRRTTIFKY